MNPGTNNSTFSTHVPTLQNFQNLSHQFYLPTATLSRLNTAPPPLTSQQQQQQQQQAQQFAANPSISTTTTPLPLQISSSQFSFPQFAPSNFPPLSYTSSFQSISRVQPLHNLTPLTNNLFLDSQFSGIPLNQTISPSQPAQPSFTRSSSGSTVFQSSFRPPNQNHTANQLQAIDLGLESPTPLFTSSLNANRTENSVVPLRVPPSFNNTNSNNTNNNNNINNNNAHARSFKPYSTLTSPTLQPHTHSASQFRTSPAALGVKQDGIGLDGIHGTTSLIHSDMLEENRTSLSANSEDLLSRRAHLESSASIRRKKHKEVEIRRRKKINTLFNQLSDELDCGPTDKASILAAALLFVQKAKASGFNFTFHKKQTHAENSNSPSHPPSDAKSD